jgi:GNAT superfamily N-acetyltransferase
VVEIRRYGADDLEACRSLWAEFDAHLAEVGPERIWVAVLEGCAVGLAGMTVRGHKAEVDPLSVSAGCRSAGIGRRLTEEDVAAARSEGLGL